MDDNVKRFWADPRFQIYSDVIKLLEKQRVWSGMGWSYGYIHPAQYLPVRDQVRKALDELKAEYGVAE